VVALSAGMAACRGGEEPKSCQSPPSTVAGGTNVVPDVVGCSKAQGEAILRARGLLFRVHPVGDVSHHDGLIVGQDPPSNRVVAEGTEVILRERCLPAPCPMPSPRIDIYDYCTCASR
jgi:hypothetical protein